MAAHTPAVSFGFLLLIIGSPSVFAAYYQIFDLLNQCGQNVTVTCPSTYHGRAGTLRWSPPPSNNCSVNFTLDSNCGSSFDRYAIYFNIRKFNLPSEVFKQDTLDIYENQYGSQTKVKSLSGYQSGFSNPASVAQLLSLYARRPAFSLRYLRYTQTPVYLYELLIDFVIVEDTSSAGNTYCSALSGYINNDYICDHHHYGTDRCNCPASYSASMGRNPAYSRRSCDSSHDAGVIAGAILGSIGFVILIGVIAMLARRRHQRILVARTCVHEPTVVGPYQQMPSYQNAPPADAQQYYTQPACVTDTHCQPHCD